MTPKPTLVLGLMSGTSADAIDVAPARISATQRQLLKERSTAAPLVRNQSNHRDILGTPRKLSS